MRASALGLVGAMCSTMQTAARRSAGRPATTIFNVFGYYNVTSSLSLSLNVNNLTNEFVVTEAEEHTGVSGDIVRARPLSARSTLLSLRYSF